MGGSSCARSPKSCRCPRPLCGDNPESLSLGQRGILTLEQNEPTGMTSSDIRNKLNKDWEWTTVLTLLSRLTEKNAASAEKGNRSYIYKSLIAKEDYSLMKSRHILDSLYNGSIKSMMTALCDSRGLSDEDLLELQEILDKAGR